MPRAVISSVQGRRTCLARKRCPWMGPWLAGALWAVGEPGEGSPSTFWVRTHPAPRLHWGSSPHPSPARRVVVCSGSWGRGQRQNAQASHPLSPPFQATKLREEEENLLKQCWELQTLEAERKLKDEHWRKAELG